MQYIWLALLTKREVKITAGHWPSYCFLHFYGPRDEVEVNKKCKKRTRPISSHLDRTSLVNEGFSILQEISRYENDLFTREAGNKANCGCSTTNSGELFLFSLFGPSSVACTFLLSSITIIKLFPNERK